MSYQDQERPYIPMDSANQFPQRPPLWVVLLILLMFIIGMLVSNL